ncbi:hypothetical protein [Desulfovibrio inopinatus]|uniref:hypothetical protein n=1 Tax=Desulfovibrio inopinatus TaxID=102109 RepID=UPI000409C0AC|nr:hypothetical protein [Desulfovibrio inopinatus]
MIDVKELLDEIKASPFEEIEVLAPHTGVVEFAELTSNQKVVGPSGTWREKPGTLLASLERERNKKFIHAQLKGEIQSINMDLNSRFVEAGTPLLTIRHFLSSDEVIETILKQVLYLFEAPERATYYFTPDVDKKIKASGSRTVTVIDGMELFIVSRMKREKLLHYTGPEGKIYTVYFEHNQNVDAGSPLIGVCPEDQVGLIQDVVNRVQSEWEERD